MLYGLPSSSLGAFNARREAVAPPRTPRHPEALPNTSETPFTTEPVNALAIIDARQSQRASQSDDDGVFSALSDVLEPTPISRQVPACTGEPCSCRYRWIPCFASRGAKKLACVVCSVFRSERAAGRCNAGEPENEEEAAQRRVLDGGYVLLTDDFVASRPRTSLINFLVPELTPSNTDSHRALDGAQRTERISQHVARAVRRERMLFQRRPSEEVYGNTNYQLRAEEVST